jgi:hypothetical protein
MSRGYYHSPPKPVSTRVRCPVCHEEVYSRAGIHPQCAVRQSEPPKPKKPAVVVTDPALIPEPVADPAPAVRPDPPDLEVTSRPVPTRLPADQITAIADPAARA